MSVAQAAGAKAFRNRIVDSPDSVAERFRARRWEAFRTTFPSLDEFHVVDLGGTVDAWLRAPVRPRKVTVIGFEPGEADGITWIDAHYADACDLPAALTGLEVDLVYSNAVLEHVGGQQQRQRFAAAVRRLAPRHWVQTPYRYFPVEPHWLFPGFQFLPIATRVAIGRRWKLAHSPSSDYESVLDAVLAVELVGLAEFRRLFPNSAIEKERIAGITKSLIAVKAA